MDTAPLYHFALQVLQVLIVPKSLTWSKLVFLLPAQEIKFSLPECILSFDLKRPGCKSLLRHPSNFFLNQ